MMGCELDHLIGRAVHRQLPDDVQDQILGIHASGQGPLNHDFQGARRAEGAHAFQNAHGQICGAHAGIFLHLIHLI